MNDRSGEKKTDARLLFFTRPEGVARGDIAGQKHGSQEERTWNQYLTSVELKWSSTDSVVATSLFVLYFTKKKAQRPGSLFRTLVQEPSPGSFTRSLVEESCPGAFTRTLVQDPGPGALSRSAFVSEGPWRWGRSLKHPMRSLAGQLAVEAGQADGEGLQGAHGVVVVQREDVLRHSAELHDDVIG